VYGAASTLFYAAGMAVGPEWGAGVTTGNGVPRHLTIDAGTGTVTMPNADRTVPGDVTVTSGTLALGASPGDLTVNGNLSVSGALATNGRPLTLGGNAT